VSRYQLVEAVSATVGEPVTQRLNKESQFKSACRGELFHDWD